MDVGFRRIKWFQNKSAYQDMVDRRARRADAIKKHLEMMDSVNAAFSGAQQDKISGLTNLAALAAQKRVQELAKAKADDLTKQIDDAKSLVEDTQTSSTTTSGNSSMLDLVV